MRSKFFVKHVLHQLYNAHLYTICSLWTKDWMWNMHQADMCTHKMLVCCYGHHGLYKEHTCILSMDYTHAFWLRCHCTSATLSSSTVPCIFYLRTSNSWDQYYPPSETQSDVDVYTVFGQKTCGCSYILRQTENHVAYCSLLNTTLTTILKPHYSPKSNWT